MKKFLKKMKKNEKGFTLIELIVVIAIIAILAAVMVPRFTNFSQKAGKAAVKQETKALAQLLSMHEASGKTLTTGDVGTTGALSYDSTDKELKYEHSDIGTLIINGVKATPAPTIDATSKELSYTVTKDSKDYTVKITEDGTFEVSP